MAERGKSEQFKTPHGMLGFDRWLLKGEKRKNVKTGEDYEQFGATLIFPTSVSKAPFEKAIFEACRDAKWGTDAEITALFQKGMIRSPFLKGDGKEAHNKKTGELHPGMGPDVWFIRPNGQRAPMVRNRDPNLQATKDEVYAGCKVFAFLNAYTWTGDEGRGVSFGLIYVQKVADGEPHYKGGFDNTDASSYYEKIADEGVSGDAKGAAGAGGLFG